MTRKVRSLLPRRRLQVQDVQKTDAVRNYRPVIVEPIKYKPKADEVVINLPGQKPRIVKRRNEVVYADNRSNVQRQLDQKKDEQIRQRYQQQKNKQAAEEGVNAMMKLVSPSTYAGAAARSLTGDGTFGDNLASGAGFNDPTANIVFDVASPFMLKSGISALSKYALNPAYNSLRNRVVSSMLNRNVRNWDGTVRMEYFNSPNKRINLTPKTSISKEEVDVPFKGKLQNYLTESGESMIYDDGQYVLKEKSLYDVNSSIDKLHQSVSRDLAMNQIPGVQPIEYLGYKINTNPQKTINGLTGEVEVKLNKTYDPIYRQRKLIPLDDPKTKFIYQPDPYRLLDRWGIKHDKDFGNVGAIKFSDFGLNNWGIDTYGRYRLFDPMIHDF